MKQRVIIIGGGPAGYHSALSCQRKGMSVTLIEQNQIGGTCTHSGCIPTRAYLSAIKAQQQVIAANPSLAKQLILSPDELYQATQQKINQLAFGMDYMLHRKKVEVLHDTATITGVREVTLNSGQKLTADHIIIATGSEAIVPESHGFTRVYSDQELLDLRNLPKEITVVGGGVLGIELSIILQAMGCRVTLAEREADILPHWDEDISKHIHAYLEKSGIKVMTSTDNPPGENGVFCIGRKPKLPVISADIHLDAPWLHILGDAAGGTLTADTAITQGEQIAAKIAEQASPSTSAMQSRCLFTPLEAASVGKLADADDLIAYQDLGYMPAGILFGADLGFIKVVIDPNSHIIKGVHLVSSMASEIIQLGQLAVSQQMTVDDFCGLTFPHPTEGELLKEIMRSLL